MHAVIPKVSYHFGKKNNRVSIVKQAEAWHSLAVYLNVTIKRVIECSTQPHLKASLVYHEAAMAEWLRRLTRTQMGSSRVGSNPTRSDFSVFFDKCVDLYYWWSSRPTILGNGFIIFQRFAGVWD